MPNNGAFVITDQQGNGTSNLKASFADFLRLRHGGTNFLFGLALGVPLDRPFHSLSYPDINYTVMRPAYLPPPLAQTTPLPTGGSWPTGTWPSPGSYIQDPGIKNPYLSGASLLTQAPPIQPPPIPTRRLFQVPDAYGSPVPGWSYNASTSTATVVAPAGSSYPQGTPPPPGVPVGNTWQVPVPPPLAPTGVAYSNASEFGDVNVNSQVADGTGFFFNPYFDLTAVSSILNNGIPGNVDTLAWVAPAWLGNHNGLGYTGTQYNGIYDYNSSLGNSVNGRFLPPAAFQQADMRQHPYYRSEWMQRVMNLTTERTHQFAVWITVGLFEVTQPGNPQLVMSNPAGAYDLLGLELGVLGGGSTRYRGFFLLDRTRATGFNPTAPGDFRDLIVYRKVIE
jgi:hypothetical protein